MKLRGAAALHKRAFEKYMESAGQGILVEMSGTPSDTSTRAKVLGTATEPPPHHEPVWCVVTSASIALNEASVPQPIAAVGRTDKLDYVIRTSASECLLNAEEPMGRTVFDVAKRVTIDGQGFRVKAVARSGLPPLGGYIVWAALGVER